MAGLENAQPYGPALLEDASEKQAGLPEIPVSGGRAGHIYHLAFFDPTFVLPTGESFSGSFALAHGW